MENKSKKRSGSFVNCVAIDRNDNNRQSILPHIHENRLELFYVCSGQGQYMVDNRYYPIGEGDIVICNQGVLHGEEPDQVRQIRSYSVAIMCPSSSTCARSLASTKRMDVSSASLVRVVRYRV